jgi:hypothetical protein
MIRFVLAAAVCCGLCGCGKMGDPSPPGPADQIIYPKPYPTK